MRRRGRRRRKRIEGGHDAKRFVGTLAIAVLLQAPVLQCVAVCCSVM